MRSKVIWVLGLLGVFVVSSIQAAPIHKAAKAGNLDNVKTLITQGINVNSRDSDQFQKTPLHYAAQSGYTEIVNLLLAKGANVNARTLTTVTRRDGSREKKWKEKSATPLQMASGEGHTEIVKILLGAGADANIRDHFETTPLIEASIGDHKEIVKLLLAAGATTNVKSELFGTAIENAERKGYKDIVELLKNASSENRKRFEDLSNPSFFMGLKHGITFPLRVFGIFDMHLAKREHWGGGYGAGLIFGGIILFSILSALLKSIGGSSNDE